jgi:hypothetical protein
MNFTDETNLNDFKHDFVSKKFPTHFNEICEESSQIVETMGLNTKKIIKSENQSLFNFFNSLFSISVLSFDEDFDLYCLNFYSYLSYERTLVNFFFSFKKFYTKQFFAFINFFFHISYETNNKKSNQFFFIDYRRLKKTNENTVDVGL